MRPILDIINSLNFQHKGILDIPVLIAMILQFAWWIGSGAIAYNMVEPHTFLSVIGFLILWFVIRSAVALIGTAIVGSAVRAPE